MDDIYSGDLLRSLPNILRSDPDMFSFCTAFSEQLHITSNLIERCIIYARIDELSADVLDVLAYDFKVDWWSDDFTLTEKRETLKESWNVHRTIGSPSAVGTALATIFNEIEIVEWFDYSGSPHHFAIYVSDEDVPGAKLSAFMAILDKVKPLRSVLDDVIVGIMGTWQYYGYRGKTINDLSTYTIDQLAAGVVVD